ncbi:Cyclopropane-fatty-acyl-phospholipid synthase [Alloactinosynnema sp. L-07]|uniref:SAM-dependent methyltransferase n=1 Tax=Alloactinosynnema sp. L-07 TaxID=1653480 RepID=UPI00065EF0F6|nr:cyclopropane-fatty-acyl-phospholipid synthase family protein [Alloactinosynnema sp. L-07]CRK57565.1 Cyclopropane-fatty-acyl-phospholipid synthase [Alloactinosynnema sp. L-07]
MTVASAFVALLPPDGDIWVTAYDGSSAGNPAATVRLDLSTPEAVSYLLSAPGELGLARAYVTGHLKITGGLYATLDALLPIMDDLSTRDGLQLVRELARDHLRRMPHPPEELPGRARRTLTGLRHSRQRDSVAISNHYDVSNRFYEMVLGPSMAYTCACYPTDDASLETAQWTKFDLVCRKLALEPGMRLLDVGCGWGAMAIHAAKHYGVDVLGVTLSREQALWAQKEIATQGLTDRVEVRHQDYRDVTESDFDAVSSIGLTEHVGAANLPGYFRFLASKLRPHGRLLNHSITRTTTSAPHRVGPFFDRYVFPDGELEGVGDIASAMQDNGFEIRHDENLREHYARTLAAWCANLDTHWDEAVRDAGIGRARVWALYMVASQLAFDRHELELHQLLGVKVDERGGSGMPLRPTWAS